MPDDKFNFDGFPDENEEFEPAPQPRRGGSFENYLNGMGGPGMPGGMPPGMGLNIGINMDALSDQINNIMSNSTALLTDFVEMLYNKNQSAAEELLPGVTEAVNNETLMDFVEESVIPEFSKFQKLELEDIDPNQIIHSNNMISDMVDGLLQQMGLPMELLNQLGLGNVHKPSTIESNEEDEEVFELGSSEYLFSNFGNFEYRKDSGIYEKFVEVYGSGPKWDSNIISGNGVKILTTFEDDIDDILKSITAFKYVANTNDYLLTFTEMDEATRLGFFVIFTINKAGEIVGSIPEFANTLDYDSGDDIVYSYYSGETSLIDDKGMFTEMDVNKVITGIKFMLAPINKPLLSLNQFGTVHNKRISTNNAYSRFVELGTVIDNDSAEATLFKKDFDIPVEEHEFKFAIRFTEELSDVARNYINDKMLNVSINDSLFANYCELQVAKLETGTVVFIDINCERIEEIIMEDMRKRKGF